MFKLSRVLEGHGQDVKALVEINETMFASASRDTDVIIWRRLGNFNYEQLGVFSKHNHFVNALAFVERDGKHLDGLVVSSGSDKIIYAFDPFYASNVVYEMKGHEDNVCALAVTPDGRIISGSWDSTARIWKNGQCQMILKGHKAAVWGVLALSDEVIVTASADRTICIWENGKLKKTISGHQDVVRSLRRFNQGFASCSNDGTIRVWSSEGKEQYELNGHTAFVYCLGGLSTGELLSAGEDRSVRIWNGPEQLQSITQPCVSVWTVIGTLNGDVVCGGSDGLVRVFTRIEERFASADQMKMFNETVSATAIPSNQIGDVNKDKLEGLEGLGNPGSSEGQVKMIRVGEMVEAYQWSVTEGSWQKIGEVVNAIGNKRRVMFDGKEFDYVFDVDIYDGQPALKLPYNVVDNPYETAQKFIEKNDLPQDYLEQIASFIMTNAKDVTLGVKESTLADPFTGSGRYIPGQQSKPVSVPAIDYSLLKVAKLSAILAKIRTINSTLKSDVLTFNQLQILEVLGQVLNSVDYNIKIGEEQWDILNIIAFKWPDESRYPGIDLIRLAVLHLGSGMHLSQGLLNELWTSLGDTSLHSKVKETNLMLVLRVFCNSFSQKISNMVLYEDRETLIERAKSLISFSENKNYQIALTTFYLNLSILHVKNGGEHDYSRALVNVFLSILQCSADLEVTTSSLTAIATLLDNNKELKASVASKLKETLNSITQLNESSRSLIKYLMI